MTCQWYYLRIWATLSSLVNASKYVRPANRSAVSKFLMSDPMIWVEQLLSGIRDVDGWKRASHWENSFIFLKFKEYIGANEKRLKTLLRKISYWVDQDNTLMTVTGGSRPEEVYTSLSRCGLSNITNNELSIHFLFFTCCCRGLSGYRRGGNMRYYTPMNSE